ncbi:myb-like protein Q [Scomber scombrus]|uniref:Myb-like protein Q n=1 Tax=Scomber scombrus TaxID=13677 RepID=A0AAV1PAG5_SCOSC
MDVSIAVSLIRGQMGAVVERAVNGAVETVLAEMLKVVGVKFEELKAQVALMKRDVNALQREKALKEKENDNIRAKLRYTELKLKYYRQGVEEELQQRASTSTLVRIHPSSFPQPQTSGACISSNEASPSCSTQSRTAEGQLAKSSQECISPQSRRAVRARGQSDVRVVSCDQSDLLLPVSLSVNTIAETLDSNAGFSCTTEQDISASKNEEQEDDCEWTIAVQTHTESMDAVVDPPPHVKAPTLETGQQSDAGSLSPDGSTQADSSTLPFSNLQVKQEAQQEEEEEEEEVICIKEEPEEEQEVMATLLLDCQMQQSHLSESETQRSVPQTSQRSHTTAFSSDGSSSYLMPQPMAPLPSAAALPLGVPPRQMVRPWNKDLSLYEEYKMRRNELRRRSLNRRRELEKNLPQPLLADLVRERREKTRLRVARWRAKRKLQACLNQAQAQGGAVGLSQTGFPISSQHHQHHQQQQLRAPCVSTSSGQQRQSSLPQSTSFINSMSAVNSISAPLAFIAPSSSSSSSSSSSCSLLLRGPHMATHVSQHAVTSSSSCSYSQVGLSQQSLSLTDTDILQ